MLDPLDVDRPLVAQVNLARLEALTVQEVHLDHVWCEPMELPRLVGESG